MKGWPAAPILRGSVVVEDRGLKAEPGGGQFVRRKLDPDVLARPFF